MAGDRLEKELVCPLCAHREFCGPSRMLARLQELGMLRRARDPDPTLLLELLESSAARLHCSHCGHLGVHIEDADDSDWDAARQCEVCGQTIPAERLEVFPDARTCVACAQQTAVDPEAKEYCEKCGAVLTLRARRGSGVTRYEPYCPDCGH